MINEVLTVVSAKSDGLKAATIQETVTQVLNLANKERSGSIHGGNLPRVTRQVLAEVLWRNVSPKNASQVMAAIDRAVESEFLLPKSPKGLVI